jgi:lambda family phage minor tail protein L
MSESLTNLNKHNISITPDTIIDLYEIDFSTLQKNAEFLNDYFDLNFSTDSQGLVYRFCPMINGVNPIIWRGNSYQPLPIKMDGFEHQGQGRLPRPTLTIANPEGLFSKIVYANFDFLNCKITRSRTFARFIDIENYQITQRSSNSLVSNTFGKSDADSHFADDIFFINKKISEDKNSISFELVSALEMEGAWVPARQIIANHCGWSYRCSIGCKYNGLPIETNEGKSLINGLSYGSGAQENDLSRIEELDYGVVDYKKYQGRGTLLNGVPEWDRYGHEYIEPVEEGGVGDFVVGTEDSPKGYKIGDVVKIINSNSLNPYINVPQLFVCIQSHEFAVDHHPILDKKYWLKDECNKTIEACEKRFGNSEQFKNFNQIEGTKLPGAITHESAGLRFGGFPGAESYPFE